MKQGTPEWFEARRGKVTASRVADIMATTKGGYSASRKNYLTELLCERLTGKIEDSYESPAMKWGKEQEPLARQIYEMETGNTVEEVGFLDHPKLKGAGASPDGRVGIDGLIEIKCPNTATHLEFYETGRIQKHYQLQMTWQLITDSRKWCDFVSYDPRLPAKLAIKIVRFEPSQDDREALQSEIAKFIAELDEKEAKLRRDME